MNDEADSIWGVRWTLANGEIHFSHYRNEREARRAHRRFLRVNGSNVAKAELLAGDIAWRAVSVDGEAVA